MLKKIYIFCFLFFSICSYALPLIDFPQVEFSNGLIRAKLFLPDSKSGYYQATRFDWSGIIESLDYKGHSYFGQWFKTYDAKRHDAITGPVEEFDAIGYEDARVGGKFLKIGVGLLRRKDEKSYSSYTLYEIANPGKWEVKKRKDRVEFTHVLEDEAGYSYVYRKTIILIKGKPELVLEHSLKNIGKRKIETNVFDHNFFVIDKQPTGPDIKIKFPFEVTGTGRGLDTLAEIRDKEINYLKDLKDNESMYIPILLGFGNDVKDYDFRIENHRSGAGVRITGDHPIERMAFCCSSTISCPEPYIHIKVDPGQEFKWKIIYEFYEIPLN